ncbi:major facilitator superfamily domain-containing protein [Daldinia decipiens]|uniref:major facilitator superfamily domain-containing protein n=1 Tax=Daldinia decipiens TaxID=326647 RepID=UPI0020C1F9F7|nr:major facilitator superfamily domain-containing protein [Daldinia decipiens]KAI1658100.1 major facilitator superfamily domain-containing protein [Daldinia decipiens]
MAEDDSNAGAQSSQTGSSQLTSWRLVTVIGSLCLGVFLFGLDVNIVAVAIPRITTQFRSLPDPLFGNLYKFFNAKVVYVTSLVIFEVGSAICAAAPTSAVLIFGQAWFGLGGAGLLQGALAIISHTVTIDKVPLYQGIVVGSMAVAVCCGPVIGGALTQYVNWRINLPAGACVIIIVLLFVHLGQVSKEANQALPVREKLRHMDASGLILFLGAITCILLALTWGGGAYPWSDQRIIGLFVGFGVLMLCFCYWLVRQGDHALIPIRYGYYLPILFQSAQGASTTESGLRYIALVGPQIVALIITGGIVSKWGYYVPYMIAGGVVCSVGAGLLTTVNLSTSTAKWATYLVLTGIGLGMAGQLPYTAVPDDVATGNGTSTSASMALLIDGLNVAVPRYTNAVTPAAVIEAGATGLQIVATSPTVLEALRAAYVEAVRRTIILGLAGICMVVPVSCAMEWINIKHCGKKASHPGIQRVIYWKRRC